MNKQQQQMKFKNEPFTWRHTAIFLKASAFLTILSKNELQVAASKFDPVNTTTQKATDNDEGLMSSLR